MLWRGTSEQGQSCLARKSHMSGTCLCNRGCTCSPASRARGTCVETESAFVVPQCELVVSVDESTVVHVIAKVDVLACVEVAACDEVHRVKHVVCACGKDESRIVAPKSPNRCVSLCRGATRRTTRDACQLKCSMRRGPACHSRSGCQGPCITSCRCPASGACGLCM